MSVFHPRTSQVRINGPTADLQRGVTRDCSPDPVIITRPPPLRAPGVDANARAVLEAAPARSILEPNTGAADIAWRAARACGERRAAYARGKGRHWGKVAQIRPEGRVHH